jgi:hypothetical protein
MNYRAPFLYRCVRVQVAPGSSTTIELEGLEDDEEVVGFYVREGARHDGFTMRLPGEEEFSEPLSDRRRQHLQIRPDQRSDDSALIELRNDGPQTHALCFALAGAVPDE